MANLGRSPKSSSDWTETDLKAFNIRVIDVSADEFFGVRLADINLDHLPPAIVTQENAVEPLSKEESLFFDYMNDADVGEESAVCDFMAFLLHILNYDGDGRLIRQRKEWVMTMCASMVNVKPDVTVVHRRRLPLLPVRADRRKTNRENPVPKLVAEMLGTFYSLNLTRRMLCKSPLDKKVIPGITFHGDVPIFFRMEVTQEFVTAFQAGMYPPEEILVQKCIPPVKDVVNYVKYGMRRLEHRQVILKCFEAFKKFVVVDP
ncbi:hypothetical protein VKT23_007255 [Stygiomarasmius scandens]|uniref:Uncharacterized protein n=1 Tax=Marasmiellus scandens TaxID=2682957 RepID=A0ABR1JM08_9AGAR